jgi:hypothetical protein
MDNSRNEASGRILSHQATDGQITANAERRMTIAEQFMSKAKALQGEANAYIALAKHLSPALDQDFEARSALERLLHRRDY